MTSTFTFVNTVDAPALSPKSAKAMRAHVTKTNFAKRRKRIAGEVHRKGAHVPGPARSSSVVAEDEIAAQATAQEHSNGSWDGSLESFPNPTQSRYWNAILPWSLEALTHIPAEQQLSVLALIRPTDPSLTLSYLIKSFGPVMFPAETTPATTPSRETWESLLVTEPAFCEATLAIGLTYKPFCQRAEGPFLGCTPEAHVSKAISLVNHRLSDPERAVSDGVLAAVFTLASHEALKGEDKGGNYETWGVHIDGLAKMITLRNTRGGAKLPSWLSDILLYSFGVRSQAEKKRYQKILDALASSGDNRATAYISDITMYMAQFHRGLELYHTFGMTPEFIEKEIEEPFTKLDLIAQRLKADDHPFLHASGHGIYLFLRLSWPKPYDTPPEVLAHNLRIALEGSKVRLCSTIDLVVWKFFIGGAAALPHSEDREWFVKMLARIMETIPRVTWSDFVVMLGRAFMPDALLLERLKVIWEECDAIRTR